MPWEPRRHPADAPPVPKADDDRVPQEERLAIRMRDVSGAGPSCRRSTPATGSLSATVGCRQRIGTPRIASRVGLKQTTTRRSRPSICPLSERRWDEIIGRGRDPDLGRDGSARDRRCGQVGRGCGLRTFDRTQGDTNDR